MFQIFLEKNYQLCNVYQQIDEEYNSWNIKIYQSEYKSLWLCCTVTKRKEVFPFGFWRFQQTTLNIILIRIWNEITSCNIIRISSSSHFDKIETWAKKLTSIKVSTIIIHSSSLVTFLSEFLSILTSCSLLLLMQTYQTFMKSLFPRTTASCVVVSRCVCSSAVLLCFQSLLDIHFLPWEKEKRGLVSMEWLFPYTTIQKIFHVCSKILGQK